MFLLTDIFSWWNKKAVLTIIVVRVAMVKVHTIQYIEHDGSKDGEGTRHAV